MPIFRRELALNADRPVGHTGDGGIGSSIRKTLGFGSSTRGSQQIRRVKKQLMGESSASVSMTF
jgi:hypothetical protein